MTAIEMSDTFEVLWNNITSNAAPGLNEYEKSVFLTKAQNEIIKNFFNPKGNKYQEGFDGSAKRQMDFSALMESVSLTLSTSTNSFDSRAKTCNFPSDLFIVVNEMIDLKTNNQITGTRQVIPITYDEYMRVMSKPYKEPLKNQAWRIITGASGNTGNTHTTHNSLVEIILNANDTSATATYKIRYVRRPKPIITANLASTVGAVSIDGMTDQTDCELGASIHPEILQRAVELAKAAYASDQSGQAQMQNQITVGQRSE